MSLDLGQGWGNETSSQAQKLIHEQVQVGRAFGIRLLRDMRGQENSLL